MTRTEVPSGFRLIDTLGRGGTAEVVRAYSAALGREVALKIALPEYEHDTPFDRLAGREQALIGGLTFPGLVRILDASPPPSSYLALEICEGPSLDSLGRIDDLTLALNIVSAMALDLEYLRLRGIIHGDFKPQNVFLPTDWASCVDGRLFYAKLSDFSLGRRLEENDSARLGVGTVGYLAPETIVENRTSTASDLFALGVTAYQLLTGVHPFMGDDTDPVAINSRCREDEPAPVNQLRPEAGEALSNLVARLLAKDEQQRPGSGWEVCVELAAIGATYPYDRALQPKHLIEGTDDFDGAVEEFARGDKATAERLATISAASLPCLRLVLTANHRRKNLRYDGQRFAFVQTAYWPARLRRKALDRYCSASVGTRRALIRAAVAGGTENLGKVDPDRQAFLSDADRGTTALLRPLLRTSTVRRLSLRMAQTAEADEEQELAARLYVQAGHLEEAELCGFQAAETYLHDHDHEGIRRCVTPIREYAVLLHRRFDIRALLCTRADSFNDSGELTTALEAYREVIGLYDGREPDGHLGRAYKNLGDVFKAMQNLEQGVAAQKKALEIYRRLDSVHDIPRVLHNLGNMYSTAGDLTVGLGYFRQALHAWRAVDDTAGVARTLNTIAAIYGQSGRLTRSIKVQHLSLRLRRELGDAAGIGSSLNNLGYCYYLMGAQGKAIAALTESLELNRRDGSRMEILHNLDSLSSTMIVAGRLRESLAYIREGISIASEIDDQPHTGQFNLNLATVQRRMGRFGQAGQTLSKVHSLLASFEDRILAVKTQIGDASLRLAIGDREEALSLASSAMAQARTLRARPEQLNALLVISQLTDNAAHLEEARTLATDLGLSRERDLVECNRLARVVEEGDPVKVIPAVEAVEAVLAARTEDIESARLCAVVAEGALQLGDAGKAEGMIARAKGVTAVSGLVPERVNILILLGRLLSERGDLEQCYASYKEALGLVKTISGGIEQPSDRERYQRTRTVQFLVAEIKRLGARLGTKTKGRP